MGTYYYYANEDKKEYFRPGSLGDNQKYPVNQAAVGLYHLLLDGRWQGDRIRLYGDGGDLPWDDYVLGRALWKDVTDYVEETLDADGAFGYLCPRDTQAYVAVRVHDELNGDHEALLARVVEAIKGVFK